MTIRDHIRNPIEWGVDQLKSANLAVGRAGHSLRRPVESQYSPLPAVRRIELPTSGTSWPEASVYFGAYRTDVILLCIMYPLPEPVRRCPAALRGTRCTPGSDLEPAIARRFFVCNALICAVSMKVASPVPCAASAARRMKRCSAIFSVCCSTPDALAANRSSCSASTPTRILSAVLPTASAAEIERSTRAASPPTVATPASAPPSVRMPVRSSSAWRPGPRAGWRPCRPRSRCASGSARRSGRPRPARP